MTPRATYRIQFRREFPFAAAADLAPYLAQLGISHLYASPIATARAGSAHGYDVVDATAINPELGGEAGFRALAAALKAQGLGIILDIVPNHMAVGGSDNVWWLDVLEQGEASPYARFFDIDWHPADPALHGKLLAPFLGTPYAEALANGDLRLDHEAESGRLSVLAYDTHRFPVRAGDHAAVLAEAGVTDLAGGWAAVLAAYDPATADGRARLDRLLTRQHYRLAWWRTAGDEINWRRFFDITELAGMRVEDEAVFAALHALPLRLYAEGLIDGVRVDHVDGLADPGGYCRRLRAAFDAVAAQRPADAAPGPAYLVVEKILGPGETLDPSWRTDGTSGYDFMDQVSALLHAPDGAAPLDALWADISGRPADFTAEERQARRETLDRTFPGQLTAAVTAFHALAQATMPGQDITAGALRRAIVALLTMFPTYRSYGTDPASAAFHPTLAQAVERARPLAAPGEADTIDRVADWIAGRRDADHPLRWPAVVRFEQLSAPLSAKAVEDTAFYRYGRLLSRTDVGFEPAHFASDIATFARQVATRGHDFPAAMLTTATHDHKRGEDVRARLAVLSEVPGAWETQVRSWLAAPHWQAIHPADAYPILQTLIGAWPPDLAPDDARGLDDFAERVAAWSCKALREAKLRSSWTAPDEAYEAAAEQAIRDALGDPASAASLARFVDGIAAAGAVNGVVQAVLRSTLPGVPDCYQGTEFWDFSLVDPDNRRPVDYPARRAALAKGGGWRNGAMKQQAIASALALRRSEPDLFAGGAFTPAITRGVRAAHLFAFTRTHGDRTLLVVVPRHVAEPLQGAPAPIIPAEWWGDTSVDLADGTGLRANDLFALHPYAMRLLG